MKRRAVVTGAAHRADAKPRSGAGVDLAVAVARDQNLGAMIGPLDEGRHEMLAVPEGEDHRNLRLDDLVDIRRIERERVGAPHQPQERGGDEARGALKPVGARQMTYNSLQCAGFESAWVPVPGSSRR